MIRTVKETENNKNIDLRDSRESPFWKGENKIQQMKKSWHWEG